jgi:hypothetical protein
MIPKKKTICITENSNKINYKIILTILESTRKWGTHDNIYLDSNSHSHDQLLSKASLCRIVNWLLIIDYINDDLFIIVLEKKQLCICVRQNSPLPCDLYLVWNIIEKFHIHHHMPCVNSSSGLYAYAKYISGPNSWKTTQKKTKDGLNFSAPRTTREQS